MCTVSYLPTNDGCLITSNRDEIISRALAEPPTSRIVGQTELLFPRDPVGGGTWIAAGSEATVCLFNGAFEPHERKKSYRVSRGVIPINFFEFDDAIAFSRGFDFEGIEPFSLVSYKQGKLHELKWDERNTTLIEHSASDPHIWASVTLYDEEVRQKRKKMFNDWLDTKPDFSQEAIINFHTSEKNDAENGLLINRENGLKTVSVTSTVHLAQRLSNMMYHDLVNRTEHNFSLEH